MIMNGDQFIFVGFGNNIYEIDTGLWALSDDQVPPLIDYTDSGGPDLLGGVTGIAVQQSVNMYATQSDGDLLFINLNDITAYPTSTNLSTGSIGPFVADTEGTIADNNLYILDTTNNALIIYNTVTKAKSSITLVDSFGRTTVPVAITFVPFPTATSTSTVDKVFITTNSGIVFVVNEGSTSVAASIALSSTSKNLPSLAATPNGAFVLVVNSSDSTVHVINTATNTEVNTDSGLTGINPIPLTPNSALNSIVIPNVTNPTGVYAYVTGALGVSIVSLNTTGQTFSNPTIIDNPLTLSSVPGEIVASSTSDGYVYTSNGDATLSVITAKPFVTISSTSLDGASLTTGGSFTVTFQSTEIGSYIVLLNGGITATGTQVASGSVATADTDTVTPSISYDASIFQEGTNEVFVFVTDSSGNVGRDAVNITVDTPPPATVITSTGFGNHKVAVNFNRLTVSDMSYYNLYVDTDPTAIATTTTVAATIGQPSSGSSVQGLVTGLANGTVYYIGVEGVDLTGNVGPRTTTLQDGSAAKATPEVTIGLAQATGETGCSLIPEMRGEPSDLLPLVLGFTALLFLALGRKWPLLLILIFLFPSPLWAGGDKSPKHWSLELKGGAWMPLNATTKSFLGSCCSPVGMAEFGFLYKSMLGFELGAGYIGASGQAVGETSGSVSVDKFSFTMIPLEGNVTFRFDFVPDQFLVPYLKAGPDYVIFLQSLEGNSLNGGKWGMHGVAGVQFLLNNLEDVEATINDSSWLNQIYFVMEGRYGWINSFGSTGVNLSGLTFTGGFLFEF